MKRKIEIDIPWSEMERLIDEFIWSDVARKILKDKLYNGTTFEELSERHHMSVQQAKRIFYKAEDKVFSKIPPEYIR